MRSSRESSRCVFVLGPADLETHSIAQTVRKEEGRLCYAAVKDGERLRRVRRGERVTHLLPARGDEGLLDDITSKRLLLIPVNCVGYIAEVERELLDNLPQQTWAFFRGPVVRNPAEYVARANDDRERAARVARLVDESWDYYGHPLKLIEFKRIVDEESDALLEFDNGEYADLRTLPPGESPLRGPGDRFPEGFAYLPVSSAVAGVPYVTYVTQPDGRVALRCGGFRENSPFILRFNPAEWGLQQDCEGPDAAYCDAERGEAGGVVADAPYMLPHGLASLDAIEAHLPDFSRINVQENSSLFRQKRTGNVIAATMIANIPFAVCHFFCEEEEARAWLATEQPYSQAVSELVQFYLSRRAENERV